MMELAHSLLLNEEALKRVPESKRPVFVFEWLRFLDKVLAAAQKVSRAVCLAGVTRPFVCGCCVFCCVRLSLRLFSLCL